MKHVIHIFGASGSGTTTLGRALAADMGLVHMDTDDYYWLPTDPKFTAKRPIDERLTLMQADINAAKKGVIISGSLTGWGDPLIPQFTHVVRLTTPTEVRIERLRQREYADFGERIRESGDMYVDYLAFLDWAAQYDTGDVTMRSKACHDEWQKILPCPLTVTTGAMELTTLITQVKHAIYGIRPMTIADYDQLHALWLSTPGMGLNDLDDSREGIAKFLARNPNTCFIAAQDSQLIGGIMCGHDGRRGYVYHTCVRADRQGEGIGRALVEAALDALKAEGIHKAALVVFDRNEKGNAFWEKLGFIPREDLVYRNRGLTELVRIDT
ncbi:MAG: GNAT family N-acetyltransferase [Clostridia bacterium]|nr:GNAT family N-acetyltransferase [Clostridia bacterium]